MNRQITFLFFLLGSFIWAFTSSAKECQDGHRYDSNLNRCVLDEKTVSTKSSSLDCAQQEGDAFKKCFNNNVDQQINESQKNDNLKSSSKPKANIGVPAVATLASGYVLLNKQETLGECSSLSTWLMLGGGVSSLLGEFMAQRSYKKKVDGLAKKYQERMQEKPLSDSEVVAAINENQKIAFDFQITQEKARQKAHKTRKNVYTLAFGLYTASSVAAIYEGLTSSTDSCSFSSLENHKKEYYVFNSPLFAPYSYLKKITKAELLEIVYRELSNLIVSPAYATTPDTNSNEGLMSTVKNKLGSAIKTTNKTIAKAVQNPYVRAGVSGVLALHSKKVADKANDHAKASKDRIKLLEKLRDDFLATGGAGFSYCTKEDRASLEKPNCYCYLEDGTKNPARIKSDICKSLFANANSLNPTEYAVDHGENSNTEIGCFTKSKQFDENCSCKQRKTKSGSDDCLRINGKLKMGSLGSVNGLKDMMKDTVKFTQGNISAGELNNGSTEQLALRLNQAKENLAKQKKYQAQLKKVKGLENQIKKGFNNSFSKAIKSGKISNPFSNGLNTPSAQSNTPKDLLKDMEETIKRSNQSLRKGNKLISHSKTNSLEEYDFNDSNNQTGVKIEDIDKVMDKSFAYNDINENEENNIFKIITNRYQRTALKRLFASPKESQGN